MLSCILYRDKVQSQFNQCKMQCLTQIVKQFRISIIQPMLIGNQFLVLKATEKNIILCLIIPCSYIRYSFCIVLHVAADGATTPGNSGSQKEAGVRFKADCNLGKS